jgi:hypothetical protein
MQTLAAHRDIQQYHYYDFYFIPTNQPIATQSIGSNYCRSEEN